MNHRFGQRSLKKLDTCHKDIQEISYRALLLSPYDFTIVHGWRDEDTQNMLVESGVSRTPWPESKHNHINTGLPCSLAVDFAPWVNNGIPWRETHIFAVIAGCYFSAASYAGIDIRWGGDWDSDGLTSDQTLLDYGHVELII